MRKAYLILISLISTYGFAQSVNSYKTIIIPLKFDFTKSENQYRLATLSKFNLNKAGFDAYYSNEAKGVDFENRCSSLYFDVVKDKSFLTTKLNIVFKDCNDNVVFKSLTGISKEKDFQVAYTEALNKAFMSVNALNYKFNGKSSSSLPLNEENPSTINAAIVNGPAESDQMTKSHLLYYAQPIKNGFQIIDSSPKVVMKIYNTTARNFFIANKDDKQGVLLLKDGLWYFEYYQNDQLMSERIEVKF